MSLTSQIEKPTTSSRVSANGPSITVRPGPSHDDTLGLGVVLEAGAGHEYAGLDQLLGEPVHRRERLERLRRGRAQFLPSVAFPNTITRIVCLLV